MMKNTLLIIFSLIFIILTTSECKKHKPGNPIDQLSPETQTGANTFGCLVDGKVFLPKGIGLNPRLTCYYQYIYSPSPSGSDFQVSASDNSNPNLPININILFDSTKIEINQYFLEMQGQGKARVNYRKFTNNLLDDYFIYNPHSGELLINKIDEINQIVSGTFWFKTIIA